MAYRKKGEIVTRSIAGETILVPVRARLADMERLIILDGIGSFVWERIDGRTSRAAILQAILDEFEVEKEPAGKDLDEFVSALTSADLIEETA